LKTKSVSRWEIYKKNLWWTIFIIFWILVSIFLLTFLMTTSNWGTLASFLGSLFQSCWFHSLTWCKILNNLFMVLCLWLTSQFQSSRCFWSR
jgi:hypothetical protein